MYHPFLPSLRATSEGHREAVQRQRIPRPVGTVRKCASKNSAIDARFLKNNENKKNSQQTQNGHLKPYYFLTYNIVDNKMDNNKNPIFPHSVCFTTYNLTHDFTHKTHSFYVPKIEILFSLLL